MRAVIAGCFLLLGMNWQSEAQNKTAPHQQPTAITLPAAIDHNRVIINAHNAFYSVEGLRDMRVKGAEACRRALVGLPLRNVVN